MSVFGRLTYTVAPTYKGCAAGEMKVQSCLRFCVSVFTCHAPCLLHSFTSIPSKEPLLRRVSQAEWWQIQFISPQTMRLWCECFWLIIFVWNTLLCICLTHINDFLGFPSTHMTAIIVPPGQFPWDVWGRSSSWPTYTHFFNNVAIVRERWTSWLNSILDCCFQNVATPKAVLALFSLKYFWRDRNHCQKT